VPPHPSEPPHIRFLFVEHAFCYRLPPDLVLPLRHCRVANPSPHRAGSGFAPYRSAPCWAHTKKGCHLDSLSRICGRAAGTVRPKQIKRLQQHPASLVHSLIHQTHKSAGQPIINILASCFGVVFLSGGACSRIQGRLQLLGGVLPSRLPVAEIQDTFQRKDFWLLFFQVRTAGRASC